MTPLISCQLRKLLRQGDIYVIALIVVLFPFLFAYLIGSGSNAIQTQLETVDGIAFLFVMLGFFNAFYGFYIISAVYSVLLISNEIESGYEGLVLSRYTSRCKLIMSKCISVVCVCIAYLIVFMVASSIAWHLLVKKSIYGGTGTFSGVEDQISIVAVLFILILLEAVVMTAVFSIVNMYLSQIRAILASVAVTIGLNLIGRVKPIGTFIPHKLTDPTTFINETGGFDLSKSLLHISVLCVYGGVMFALALFRYKKMDYVKRGG